MKKRCPRLAFLAIFAVGPRAFAQATTELVSADSAGTIGDKWSAVDSPPHPTYCGMSTSGDGQFIAFASYASNLVAGDTNGIWDVFVRDRATGVTERVSVDSTGVEGTYYSWQPSISSDGHFVAFSSGANNLVAGDTNNAFDIFVHDRSTGSTERVSVDSSGGEANGSSQWPSISSDGRYVAFASDASNLVAGDSNGKRDIYVHDRQTGTTERVSVDSSAVEGNGDSGYGGVGGNGGLAISGNGFVVAFASTASNLVAGDTNGASDVFVRDRVSGTTERVSVDSSSAQADASSSGTSLSFDGSIVAFDSDATNLVAGDTNGRRDVFVRDRLQGTTERDSVDSFGAQGISSPYPWDERIGSYAPAISADGNSVSFVSDANNLVLNDNWGPDVFAHDRDTGYTEKVSVDSAGASGTQSSRWGSISGDGNVVTFASLAPNLVPGDTNGEFDVFARKRWVIDATSTAYGQGLAGTNGEPKLTPRGRPVLGTTLDVDISNSSGAISFGMVFVGFQRAQWHTSWGGDLLVAPTLALLVGLPTGGTTMTGPIANDESLAGLLVDLQVLEHDPGALRGVSFSSGLELTLGR
jgi:hypothetical protein